MLIISEHQVTNEYVLASERKRAGEIERLKDV